MALTNFATKKLLDHVLGTEAWTPPSTVYLALSSTAPTKAGGNITEPTFTGYARQAVAFAAAVDGATVSDPSEAANNAVVEFGDPDSDGSASHYVIFDAATGGNALDVDALTAAINWQGAVENPISFPVGNIVVKLG
jgi:hypothetical protein